MQKEPPKTLDEMIENVRMESPEYRLAKEKILKKKEKADDFIMYFAAFLVFGVPIILLFFAS